jgi:osmotically-inducible protein OsmY
MQTDTLHDDVVGRSFTFHELDHDAIAADELRYLRQLSRQREDADVQRDVMRALFLDSLVPLTVDARVLDGTVTLSGTVDSEWEREDAKCLASSVPGVFGIVDVLSLLPRPMW